MKKLNKEEFRQLYMLRQTVETLIIRIGNVKKILDKKGWGERDSLIDDIEYEAKDFVEELCEIEKENFKL